MPPGAKEAVSNDSSVGIVQFVQIEDSFVQFSPSPLVGAVGAQILLNLQQALASRVQPPPAEAGRLAEVRACLDQLTPRERDVLLPLVRGYTNREMAEQLAISVKTIDLYRSRVMKRMQAETLAELVGMVIAAGLVDALDLRGAP